MNFIFPFAAAEAESVGEKAATGLAPETTGMLILDVSVFFVFVLLVVGISIFMSRRVKEGKESESYFLAGRGLGWWLIGFSLIAANISTEQFVGMSGNAANYIGLAIASYEWLAAVTLVVVAFFFLPQLLKSGVYTIPEFLEKRYNRLSRTIMSLLMVVTLITVSFAAMVYSGSLTFEILFKDVKAGIPLNLYTLSYAIGFVAVIYVASGGLKACAWADLIQGSSLIVGGGIILYFAMKMIGSTDPSTLMTNEGLISPEIAGQLADKNGWERFMTINADKLRMNLPWDDSVVPVTALFIGLWIPNFYYWGLNQYIVQRT
ncbi:MAG: sodium:solute symporter family transporter, partial [Thermoguttaceae bacterium]